MEIMKTSIAAILENIQNAEEYLNEESIEKFENIIINANNVFVTGAGRSGLAAKAFAMRLMHLGLSSYVVGETISPAINEDDCIVAISGSGETNTIVSAAKIAKARGSKVLAVTSYDTSTLAGLADGILLVKGRTKQEVDDENYMKRQIHGNYTSLTPLGTAFELTTLVFLDAIVSELMEKMEQTESDLKARHTVLEYLKNYSQLRGAPGCHRKSVALGQVRLV